MIEHAAKVGFDGVEILHRQMADESPAYVNNLRKLAFANGLALPMLSIHQDFVDPDPAVRKKEVDHTKGCIDLAARLGIPCIRLNSGRWNTIPSFDDLMKVKGDEPPLPGHTEDEAFKWCIGAIEECLPAAEKAGVMLALENPGSGDAAGGPARIWLGALAVARHQPRHRPSRAVHCTSIEKLAPPR